MITSLPFSEPCFLQDFLVGDAIPPAVKLAATFRADQHLAARAFLRFGPGSQVLWRDPHTALCGGTVPAVSGWCGILLYLPQVTLRLLPGEGWEDLLQGDIQRTATGRVRIFAIHGHTRQLAEAQATVFMLASKTYQLVYRHFIATAHAFLY